MARCFYYYIENALNMLPREVVDVDTIMFCFLKKEAFR